MNGGAAGGEGLWFAVAVTMVHTLWVGAVVGVAAVGSRFVLRRAGARVRYGVALGWLGVLAAVPVGVGAWVMRGEETAGDRASVPVVSEESGAALRGVPLRSAPAWGVDEHGEGKESVVNTGAAREEGRREVVGERQGAVAGWLMGRRALVGVLPGVWGVGAVGMLGWSLLGLAGAERLRRGARGAGGELEGAVRRLGRRVGVRGRVGVMLSERVAGVVLVGVLRPVILVPAALVGELSPGQVEMILLHELAHVRRWDNLVNVVQRVVESVLFFQPAVWVVSGWVRQEREHCCDDVVVGAGLGEREEYAGALVAVNQWRAGWAIAGSAAGGGNLVERVRRIVTRRDTMRVSRACVVALVVPAVLPGVWIAWGAGPAVVGGEGKVIRVEKEGGEYKTIQAAIDAAPEGAVVKVGPGVWEESVTIKKGVTLEGAGWERTAIVKGVSAAAREAVKELGVQMEKGRTTVGEWDKRAKEIHEKFALGPAIKVDEARGVTIRGLKVAGQSVPYWNGSPLTGTALVEFDRSAVGEVRECAIVGSPGDGVWVSNGSDVRVEHSLVGGLWGTGVAVGGLNRGEGKVVVADCDVRVCYYAGVTVGKGSDATVERCRIWGTAWHGIRYDDASPVIQGNSITRVARLGLYASGDTHATVTGNVIAGSEGSGMWCLPGNRDVITGNTFTNNNEAGIAVTGDAGPVVERNIFFYQPVAIICGADGVKGKVVGHPKLVSNWVWPDPKAATPLSPGADPTTHVEEVRFVGWPGGNYTLPAEAPARKARVGAADPVANESPFDMQPEERAIMPEKADWDYQLWKKG